MFYVKTKCYVTYRATVLGRFRQAYDRVRNRPLTSTFAARLRLLLRSVESMNISFSGVAWKPYSITASKYVLKLHRGENGFYMRFM